MQTLKDLNESCQCKFQQNASNIAVIQNPCNKNELLIFSCEEVFNVHCYNTVRNKITTKKINFIPKKGYNKYYAGVQAVSGNTNDTVIVLWGFNHYDTNYGVFNCKNIQFDFVITSHQQTAITNVNSILHTQTCYTDEKCEAPAADIAVLSQTRNIQCAKVHKIDNFLFVFCGSNPNLNIREDVVIYDITDQYKPKRIYAKDIAFLSHFGWDGSIMFSKKVVKKKDSNLDDKFTNRNYFVRFLFLGCHNFNFDSRFREINFDINVNSDDSCYIQCKHMHANQNEWGISQLSNIYQDIITKEKHSTRRYATNYYPKCAPFSQSSYHWYKSRYLIVVGGSFSGQSMASDRILCFDYKLKRWYINQKNYKYKMPISLFDHKSILIQDKHELYLHVFGGHDYDPVPYYVQTSWKLANPNGCLKFRLAKRVGWNVERLIWIGHLKNYKMKKDGNGDCIFARMPKDLIHVVLSFIQDGVFIFVQRDGFVQSFINKCFRLKSILQH